MKVTDIKLGTNWSRSGGLGDLDELVASLREHGQITPVIVDKENNLVAGYRRYHAALQLGWDEIAAVITDRDPRIINLIENMAREGLTLWQEIEAIREVFPAETPQAEIARALSKSRPWVKPRVDVWALPRAFINKVRTGQADIRHLSRELAERRGPSNVSKNVGFPSQSELKRMITFLVEAGRTVEATALGFAVGAVSAERLKNEDV